MTANDVDRAIAAPVADRARQLLKVREDQWFDRKSSRTTPAKLAPLMVALANADGGTIAVGLCDGEVEGLGSIPLSHYQQAPMDFTVPPVRAQFDLLDCRKSNGEPARIIIIRVEPSERVHETTSGDCYLRVGDESRKLRFSQRQELEFDKGQSHYDGTAVSATQADLDQHLIENYKSAMGVAQPTTNLLKSRSLLTPKGDLTNAALLLFGRTPQQWFPQAYVRVIKFLDETRGTGSNLNVDDREDHRIEGSLPYMIQAASKIIERLVPAKRSLGPSGKFEPQPIVPRDAWLEGLVNAVVHRSYSLGGDHIRVEIYPNRIEIESPGRFPGLADPRTPQEISRFARNPRIARVCCDLRIGQELGEGIKRIFAEMRSRGLTDPVYTELGGSVRLVLTNLPRLDPAISARLPPGSEVVLDLMRANGRPLGTGEIAELLDVVRPTAQRRLKALETEGLITWIGKSTRDPRAHWVLSKTE